MKAAINSHTINKKTAMYINSSNNGNAARRILLIIFMPLVKATNIHFFRIRQKNRGDVETCPV